MNSCGEGKFFLQKTDLKNRQCVILFLKAPEKGGVKTRLEKKLGKDIPLHLYRHFVTDTLHMLRKQRIILCYHPPGAEAEIRNWLGEEYICMPQEGNDLGERMHNAFIRAFAAGYREVLLTGSDIPDLPEEIIREAFAALREKDAVIGPACDGGYYLIGFRKAGFSPDVFRNIPWSTATVFEDTLKIFSRQQSRIHILPGWRDIDEYEDLMDFRQRAGKAHSSETLRYLESVFPA